MDASSAREAVKLSLQLCALVCGLICAAACNRKSKAEQLAALERAQQSGILTQEEYEAKKAAIVGAASTPTASPPVAPVPPSEPSPTSAIPPPPPVQPARVAKAGASDEAEAEPAPSSGCEDAEYKSKKKGPQQRFFPMPEARVKKAALAALESLDFTIHNDSGNEIEASKRRHASAVIGAGGEREILHLEAAQQRGQSGTRVTGETKKSVVGRVTQKSWTAAVLAQIACNLK